jgi:hypothetical protein
MRIVALEEHHTVRRIVAGPGADLAAGQLGIDLARARAFLDARPVSPADRTKIAHGNADRLLRLPG